MKRISTELTRAILARHFDEGMGPREISRAVSGVTVATASRKISDFKGAGLDWEEMKVLTDSDFESRFHPRLPVFVEVPHESIYAYMRGDRKQKRTLEQAYEQCYLTLKAPEGSSFYKYTRFCELHGQWLKANTGYRAVSVIPCEPGDYIEIDFSGDPLEWRDFDGINHHGHVFVATLRFSKLMYAHAFENEKTESWLQGTVGALEFFGGSPRALVCDNARSLVSKADPFVGEITTALHYLCGHYQMQPHTTPVRSPRHKQSAEYTANLVQRGPQLALTGLSGMAVARDLRELNVMLLQRVEEYNNKSWTNGAAGTRRSCFENMERNTLRPLPILAYEVCRWTTLTASSRYLVTVDGQAYMVNWTEAGKRVAASLSPTEVRFYRLADYRLVGRYDRAYGPYSVHTDPACMSPADLALRRGYDGAAESFSAQGYGTVHILRFLKTLFNNDDLPQMTRINIMRGLNSLCKKHGGKLIEQACEWAEKNGCLHMYPQVKNRVYAMIRDINNRTRAESTARGGAK